MKFISFNKWALALLSLIMTTNILAGASNVNHQAPNIQNKIKQLCMDRYRSPGDFIKFTTKLQDLGVARQTYDLVQDEFCFYSKKAVLSRFTGSDIDKSIDKNKFELKGSFDVEMLKKTIAKIDNKKISPSEFHYELAQAGVVFVIAYLNPRIIYYFGQDGKYFLEHY